LKDLLVKDGEFKMSERIEFLREALHEAIDKGDIDDILKASIELDIEIAEAMLMLYTPNKVIYG
jgi:hypothetical protein